MNAIPPVLTSPWILDLQKQIQRRKHVLLYGNIHDKFLHDGDYKDVQQLLDDYFIEKCFNLILRFDLLDGWSFIENETQDVAPIDAKPLPSEKRALFDELKKREMLNRHPDLESDTAVDPLAATPVEVNPLITPPQGIPGSDRTSQLRRLISPEDAFADLRVVLAQNQASVAAMVDLADMLTSDPDHYAGEERNALMFLKKCTSEASIIPSGPLAGQRNTLIILADELKRVPEWFYRDNPFVALVQVGRPNKDERRQFARHFIRPSNQHIGFFEGKLVSEQRTSEQGSELDKLAEEFADLTEGFQNIDLEALRITSYTAHIPAQPKQVRRLVDFFKFGLKDDPWEKLNPERVRRARDELSKKVIGQPRAVDAVVAMLTSARVGLNISGGSQGGAPKGVFFFVGPTGVGKTELAKAVTQLVFGDERAFARFDMSEYKEEHAAEKLAGAPPGFVGYEEGGQLTNRVLQNPHSILLFDEIEKAHAKVLDKFLQILEDGRLTDGKGQTAYFNQTAIIFTSNIGASDLADAHSNSIIRDGIMHVVQEKGTDHFTYAEVTKHFEEEVKWYFNSRIGRAELLNRLGDNIIVFDLLRTEFVEPIGLKFTSILASRALEKFGVTLQFAPSWFEFLREEMKHGDNMLMGGRRIKTLTTTHLVNAVNEWIFSHVTDSKELANCTLNIGISGEGVLEVCRVNEVENVQA